MNPNLKWKAVFIAVVILGCIYGLVGLPTFPTSIADVKSNFAHQIKLGLDLQGGTHLILQVQVQEAIAQETDQTVDRLTNQLRTKNIHYDEVRRVDDTHIVVRNIPDAEGVTAMNYFIRPVAPDGLTETMGSTTQRSTPPESIAYISAMLRRQGVTAE